MNIENQMELGHRIASIREGAGIKQGELARKITWSPAVLSRVESGERPVTSDELRDLLNAIGTEEASKLSQFLEREWTVLNRPPLDHPDQDLLWEAEQVAKQLTDLRENPDIRQAFERRITEYLAELSGASERLLKREHQIAFVGSIGIGKSTAICRVTGLEIPDDKGDQPTPVLEAGSGGITICEVHLRTGPGYGLLVEPCTEDEVRSYVFDLAEQLVADTSAPTEVQEPDREGQGVSKEIDRAIKNMAGLRVRREKGADGKTIRHDETKALASRCASVRELVVEILTRMELQKRDKRDIWYDPTSGKAAHVWLKECFELVNNGRHTEISLPRRIEIVVPRPLIDGTDLSLRIVDTKGVDRTAARADLESLLDDPHTLSVLCSGFNNAPGVENRILLERAIETGVTKIGLQAALLVLPKFNEAMAAKDDASGVRVESAEEGYELKGEQIALSLQPLQLQDLPVEFFNSFEEDPSRLQGFVLKRLADVRSDFRNAISAITANARLLLENYSKQQTEEVLREASSLLSTWASNNGHPAQPSDHLQDDLLSQIGRANASTVRASIRRGGEWPNLSYSHHLGFGARRLAVMSLGKRIDGFSELCATLSADANFTEAADMISQADRVLRSAYEDLLRKMQITGQNLHKEQLSADAAFWSDCNGEWGRGPGYRDRVFGHNRNWFGADKRKQLETELWAFIGREWTTAIQRMTALFEV